MNKPADAMQLMEKHFDTAFAAPDGIKKLRELILTLAMQGKLVPQDPNDQPASELLKKIEAEKKRLVKEGKIKEPKPLPAIKPEEVPYELPTGWEWVRLGKIADYNGRKNVSPEEIAPDTWLLDLEDIEKDTSKIIYRANYLERQSKSTKSVFRKGDILYGKLRPYLDKVVVADNDGVCTTEIVPIVPFNGIDSQFVKWLLKRPSFLEHVNSLMYGVKMPRLGTEDAINSIHPLPPIAEQHRIVAKINQLMSRCDELGKLRAEHGQKRIAAHTAALNRLLTATEGETFNETWAFIMQNFGELYSVKENVAELRKAILQLAIMGKLVPQVAHDQPAKELLNEIATEKKRLLNEGKIKAPKPLPAIKPEEVPYALPTGWEWVRLGSLSSKIHYGYTTSANHNLKDTRLLRITDIQDNGVDWNSVPGCEIKEKDVEQYLLANKDILIARTGGTVGKSYLVENIDIKVVFASYLIRVVPSRHVEVNYLKYFLEGPLYWKQLYAKCSGTGQPNVNGTSLSTLLLSLPPLAEQHRIVAKIDQLMALCDDLEKQIETATGRQTALLNAVMAQV